jgi:Spy/CpxP family protein refolding chaperone
MNEVKAMPRLARSAVRWLIAGTVVVTFATVALSADAQERGSGPLHGPHGPGQGAMMMFGGSPEQVARHVDRMLDGLSATDAQRSQIKQIAQAAAADLKTQHEAGKALRERGLQIFAAPTVDANAAESVRQQIEAQHDQASRRMLQAMLDVSRVLTPEQRAKMAERAKQQQAMMQERMQRMQREHGGAASKPQ